MKTQIRQGVFETNSSSVHAISIFTDDDFTKNNAERYVTITTNEFGWKFETYNDLESKLSYLYTAYLDLNDYYNELLNLDWFIPTIIDLCEKHNINVDFDNSMFSNILYNCHGVDHCEDLIELFKEFEQSTFLLESFLFNDKSTLATGNDNSDEDPKLIDEANFKYIKTN